MSADCGFLCYFLMRSSIVCLSRAAALLGVAAFIFAAGAGCARPNDRCWVRPDRHEQAQRLYERTGSIKLTAEALAEADWLPCHIEQTIARLEKENSL